MNPFINRDFAPAGTFFVTRDTMIAGRAFKAGQELDQEAIDRLGPTLLRAMWGAGKLTQVRPNKDAVRAAALAPADLDAQVAERRALAARADAQAERDAAMPGPRDQRDVRAVVVEAAADPAPSEMSAAQRAAEAAEAEAAGARHFRSEQATKPLPGATKAPADLDETSVETPSGKAGKAKK